MSDLSYLRVLSFRTAFLFLILPLLHLRITGISVLSVTLRLRPACSNGSLTNYIMYFWLHISSRLNVFRLFGVTSLIGVLSRNW